jgi:dihydrofolate reductase
MQSPIYELIVAMNHDGIIGITDASGNQRIPWSRDIGKIDMQHFRKTTIGNVIIMGRKTFESLPVRPLPGRINIVITRTPSKYDEKFSNIDTVFFSRLERLDDIIEIVLGNFTKTRVFVCGGEEIYRVLLPRCERLHITYLNCPVLLAEGETASRFPIESEMMNGFQETSSITALDDYTFKTFDRIASRL